MSPYFLIFGFGYTANFLATKLVSYGFRVIGTTRKENINSVEKSKVPGVKLIDFASTNMEDYIHAATHLLVSIPPPNSGEDLVLKKYADLIKRYGKQFHWIGYLSSTGVYGDHQGQWVDEKTLCKPHTPTGIARLKAERQWFSYAKENQLPLHIFRLSGIYGPGRSALDRLLAGKKHNVFKEGQVFCRIHVEDISATLLASMNLICPLSIYNVSDDTPASVHEVDEYAASLLNQKPPILIPFSEEGLSPMQREFYNNNRRVSNLKIKEVLHVNLKYPSFREGLMKIWGEKFASQKNC